MHPAKEIHMVKRHLRLLVVTVACIALLGGCASKYGAQTTQVNYYPQCYSPVAQLRADEDRVTNSTAGGAAGGALLGALIGGLATGKVEGALAGAVAGGAAGAVGGNIYGKSQQRENDRRLLASYAAQLGEDSAGMDRATAAARLSARCYDEQFKKAAAQYKAGAITRQDLLGEPLILSRQAIRRTSTKNEFIEWFKDDFEKLDVVATLNLVYNAALLAESGVGHVVTLDGLVNTSEHSHLCFRFLEPRLESGLNIVWKKYQVFSPAAEVFLQKIQAAFGETV